MNAFLQKFALIVAGVLQGFDRVVFKGKLRELYRSDGSTDKEQIAQEIARQHDVRQGLVCVLQCVEPCWTFDTKKMPDGSLTIGGERGKCSHWYHYYIHPQFGWMYVRLQTWFPFEVQIGINGREWLARQMDRENLKYARQTNDRYLEALATLNETRTVREVAEPLTCRVSEPAGRNPPCRHATCVA
jgi:hypothetical protein